MQAHRILPLVIGILPAFLSPGPALAAERRADCGTLLAQIEAEMRVIQQAQALEAKRAPKPPPTAAERLLDEERVREHFRQLRPQRPDPVEKAPEPRGDPLEAAHRLVENEQRRAAELHDERLGRLLASATRHLAHRRFDAAANALRRALELDPRNAQAAGLIERVEADRAAAQAARTGLAMRRETAKSMRYIDQARIPQADVLTVPKDWAERKPQAAVFVTEVPGADPAEKAAAVKKALAKQISIEAVSMSLGDIAAYLRQAAGLNIVLDQDVADKTVDLRLANASVESILAWVTKLTELSYAVRGGVVYVGPAQKMTGEAVVKVYDVSDLLRVRRLLRRGRRRQGDIVGDEVESLADLADELMDFVKEVTGRKRWGDNAGQAQMNFRLGRLVVNAEPPLQLKVLEVLSKIRD
ncbi:MAG: hypothetical protein ABIF82_00030 [Planctomycetota bacterium]